jgi:hypothetical protein
MKVLYINKSIITGFLLFLGLFFIVSSPVKAQNNVYKYHEFMIAMEDVDFDSGGDSDINDANTLVKAFIHVQKNCSNGTTTFDCLRHMSLTIMPVQAGATHDNELRIYLAGRNAEACRQHNSFGNPTCSWDIFEHDAASSVSAKVVPSGPPNNFYRLYKDTGDMFTCNQNQYINTNGGTPTCQGVARTFSFHVEQNVIEFPRIDQKKALTKLIQLENHTLGEYRERSKGSSGTEMLVTNLDFDSWIPNENIELYDSWGLASGNSSTCAIDTVNCDINGGIFNSGCVQNIRDWLNSVCFSSYRNSGTLVSSSVDDKFRAPPVAPCPFDTSSNTINCTGTLHSPSNPAQLFLNIGTASGYNTWFNVQKLRGFNQIVDPTGFYPGYYTPTNGHGSAVP